jgi:acetamidase/formamidase
MASPRLLLLACLAAIAFGQASSGRTHRLLATPQNVVIGYFDAHARPVLSVASGDILDVDTLITSTPDALERMGLPASEVQQSLRNIFAAKLERGPAGHILTGPIFVEGAEPGDALEVRVLFVDLAIPYGYQACSAKWTFVPDSCEEPKGRIIRLDPKRNVAEFAPGIEVPLTPFFGILGVAPVPEAGRISSLPPGTHGGNLDIKQLIGGAKVFLPVRAEGALFEVGDGHAAQGDGESGGTALETSLRGRLQLIVHKGMKLTWPRAETATDFITLGADPDLTKAGRIANREMILFLMQRASLSRTEANRLAGIAGDLHFGELSDENVLVYMTLPKKVLSGGK